MGNMKKYINANGIIGTILLIIGIILIIWDLWVNWKVKRITSWPTTNATVISSVAAPGDNCIGNTYLHADDIVATVNDKCTYVPMITYRYSVGGRTYQSSNIAYNGPRTYPALATKTILEQTKPGSTIVVYYDHNDQEESYIMPGEYTYMKLWLGIFLVLLSLFLGYRAYTKATKSLSVDDHNNVVKSKSISYDNDGNVVRSKSVLYDNNDYNGNVVKTQTNNDRMTWALRNKDKYY